MLRKNILFMVLLLGLALTARAQANEQIQLHHVNTKGYAVRVCYRDVNGIIVIKICLFISSVNDRLLSVYTHFNANRSPF